MAVRFTGIDVRLGDISLDDSDWRNRVLDQAGALAGLDAVARGEGVVPGGVAVCINWAAYALRKIGAPAQSLGELNMVRFDRAVQRLDIETFEKHWPVIERLARALIEKGRLTESEVAAMLEPS